jgi:glycosyltransferase involved in cell wall biosynthesis
MKITCVCPTHGRAHIIGEAVESFLRQDYDGDAELLIVNDCPEQPLECDAHGVRVINLPWPIPDAAAKFNESVRLADGDLIAWWEDDDISLPHRLRRSLFELQFGAVRYVKPSKAFAWTDGRIVGHNENLFFGGSMFRRDYFFQCGGSNPGEWADATAHDNMVKGHSFCIPDLSTVDTWFVYRWGGPVHHDSGTGEQDASKRFADFRARTLAHRKFRPGLQRIEPRWRMDYTAQVAEFIGRHGNA